MSNNNFFDNINAYGKWKSELIQTIDDFQSWLDSTDLDDSEQSLKLYEILHNLKQDQITLAFVGEFSRGKTELINAIFFSHFNRRLLASEAGRTTMCPTELFFDAEHPKPYLHLLPIESRLEDASIAELKKDTSGWTQMPLDISSSDSMAEAFSQITKTKQVMVLEARRLGLYDMIVDEGGAALNDIEKVEIPLWRHARINFPHPLLQQGLAILDTPGLNSLGNEPELTINMLPGAQAAVFVLAADTGVTRSDMDIWKQHLKSFRRRQSHGMIIALNKIDTLWDPLKTEYEIKNSITRQRNETAKILGIESKRVFAVSAQKALVARIKKDQQLLAASNLEAMENVFAREILPQKELLLRTTIINSVEEMMQQARSIIVNQFKSKKKSIVSLDNLSGQNQDVIQQLLNNTREEQSIYHRNVENLQSSRQTLAGQSKRLKNIIDLDKLDSYVNEARNSMQGSWTTNGMKSSMKKLFDFINQNMIEAAKQTELTNRLMASIYNRFQSENNFEGIKPKLFSITRHENKIEELYQDAEEYRTSVYATITEQSFVIKKFFISLVSQARSIYYELNKEADEWSQHALSPLVKQIKIHKQELKDRLEQLKKASQSKESITTKVEELAQEARRLKNYVDELDRLLKILNSPVIESSKSITSDQASK